MAKFALKCCGPPPEVNHISGDNLIFNNTTNGNINTSQASGSRISQVPIPDALLKHVATGALHTSPEVSDAPGHRPSSLAMDGVYCWATTASKSIVPIQWVYGSERSGKSTLLRAIAKMLSHHNLLLASFFFSKTANYRNKTTHFIPTIAYQIACSMPTTRPYMERAIDKHPLIFSQSLNAQAQALIVLPIKQAYQEGRIGEKYPHVIIVDGLDECEGEEGQQGLLRILNRVVGEVPITLAFLVASRPEPHILGSFDSELRKSSTRLELRILDEADEDVRIGEDLCETCKPYLVHTQTPKPCPFPPYSGVVAPAEKALSEPINSGGPLLSFPPSRPKHGNTENTPGNRLKREPEMAAEIKRADAWAKFVTASPKDPIWRDLASKPIQDPSKLLLKDIIIAFMGPTGTGKSNLIDVLTGRPARAGSRLKSCTQEIEAVRLRGHPVYEDRIVFVDIPSFDNTTRSDHEILDVVGQWLKKTYHNRLKLAGIVYLHRIIDNRMSGAFHRNLRLFVKLCGDRAAKKVMLVTTMWDRLGEKRALGNEREKQLIDKFWKDMLSQGAKTARFDNTPGSAWEVIEAMLQKEKQREPLLLQEELVDLKYRLNKTTAGQALQSFLQETLEEPWKRLQSLRKEAKEGGRTELEGQYKQIEEDYNALLDQLFKLKMPISRRLKHFFGT